jgi:hypothetical protein
MGQYFVLANLDKQEFLDPYKMGHGAKAVEQSWGPYGLGQALLLLLGTGMGRGGGDFAPAVSSELPYPEYGTPDFEEKFDAYCKAANEADEQAREVLGRWAGDRIVFVGDYAEDSDAKNVPGYGSLWTRINGYADEAWADEQRESEDGYPEGLIQDFLAETWNDISALVQPYMTANFGCGYEPTTYGMRLTEEGDDASVKLAPDMTIGGGD